MAPIARIRAAQPPFADVAIRSDPIRMSLPAFALSTPAQRELLRILAIAYGGDRRALDAVEDARAASAVADLPETGTALFAFVTRALVPVLTDDLGPRLTIAVVEELERLRDFDRDSIASSPVEHVAVAPSSRAPASGPRGIKRAASGTVRAGRGNHAQCAVLLVDTDRLERVRVARALIHRRCDVTVVESAEEVKAALGGSDDFGVAVVNLDLPAADDVLGLLVSLCPALPVLARASDQEAARARLRAHRVAIFATCDRAAAADDVAVVATSYVSVERRGD